MPSATPQKHSVGVFKGGGEEEIKIAYLPKAMFSELKPIDSLRAALLFPSEWIFKFGTHGPSG